MRVIIDMQGAQSASRHRGIGRYTLAHVKAIIRNKGHHEIFLVLSGLFPDTIEMIRYEFDSLLPQRNILVWHAPSPKSGSFSGSENNSSVAEILREDFIARLNPDIVHLTSLFEGFLDDAVMSVGRSLVNVPVSLTLYDLIPLLNPSEYLIDVDYRNFYNNKLEQLLRSSLLLSISEYSKKEFESSFPESGIMVTPILAGCDPQFKSISISEEEKYELLRKYKISRPFVLFSGATDDRKNLVRLIEGYAALPKDIISKHQLVFAGGMPDFHRMNFKKISSNYGLRDSDFRITGYVSDDEMVKLYNMCKVYAFPSWHEGFGLTVLEAMSCGAPVIASNATSLPEVVGLDAEMFDPFDVGSITEKLSKALTDESFRTELALRSRVRASEFSWDRTAKASIKAWEHLNEKQEQLPSLSDNQYKKKLISMIAAQCVDANEKLLLDISKCICLNHSVHNVRTLFVDVSEFVKGDAKTGIQRVVRNILYNWNKINLDSVNIELVYATEQGPYLYARSFKSKLFSGESHHGVDEPCEFSSNDIFFVLDLHPNVQCEKADFYQFLRRNGVIVKFMVYDILPLQFPHFFPDGAAKKFSEWLGVVAECDGAICISQSVARELKDWVVNRPTTRLRPFDIDFVHLGCDLDNVLPVSIVNKYLDLTIEKIANKTSFLLVGTLEPRKGYDQVIEAFENLWEQNIDVNLVIVGKQGWKVEGLVKKLRCHKEAGVKLFWFEGISDFYLEKMYSSCTAVIAASYSEGFGLPIVEASRRGIPILCRDIPVFREVAGKYAYFFEAHNAFDLSQSIKCWMVDFDRGKHPISDGIKKLTWSQVSARILQSLNITS